MRNIRKIKLLWLWVGLAWTLSLSAQGKLNMHIDANRFRDASAATVMQIDYQIPYRNLIFMAQKGAYFAELKITLSVAEGDSLYVIKELTDNVGVTNKEDAFSDKSHLNRISIVLDSQPRKLYFKAQDLNSNKVFLWEFEAAPLAADEIISDIQLCSMVQADSTAFARKFHRGNMLYQTEPSLIFDKGNLSTLYLYFEVYPSPEAIGKSQLLSLYLEKDGEIVRDDYIDFVPNSAVEGITLRIPLEELESGSCQGVITLQMDTQTQEREIEFFVTETQQTMYFMMSNPDDEIVLLRYFSGNQMPADWSSYDDQVKRRFISGLWRRMGTTAGKDPARLVSEIEERVDFANRNFKYFKDGWKTDIGRIYIRNGKPEEVEKDTTSDDTRYVRKDYQIWKYRGKINAVYVFVDMQMNGNFQLVYSQNDDMESTNSDFLRYLGEDFDTSKLRN